MITNKLHEGLCGIYCIRNLINNKVYIGKSINIRQRIYSHIGALNSKDLNRDNGYFINSWWKHGSENFEYFILEIIDKNLENLEEFTKEREFFWMNYYKSTNRDFGYNLRQDSSTKMIVHEETKKRYSDARKKQYENPEARKKTGEGSRKFWKENPEIKKQMIINVSNANTKYSIYQYSKDGKNLIKIWNKMKDILIDNPNYKTHTLYSTCSGEKPTAYGFKWVKVLNDDIVQAI